RKLVQRLADGLALARQQREPAAHCEDSEDDRQQSGEREIDHRLVDRHVERAQVDADPLLQLELVGGVEGGGEHAQRIFSDPKYSASETASVSEYARA